MTGNLRNLLENSSNSISKQSAISAIISLSIIIEI